MQVTQTEKTHILAWIYHTNIHYCWQVREDTEQADTDKSGGQDFAELTQVRHTTRTANAADQSRVVFSSLDDDFRC